MVLSSLYQLCTFPYLFHDCDTGRDVYVWFSFYYLSQHTPAVDGCRSIPSDQSPSLTPLWMIDFMHSVYYTLFLWWHPWNTINFISPLYVVAIVLTHINQPPPELPKDLDLTWIVQHTSPHFFCSTILNFHVPLINLVLYKKYCAFKWSVIFELDTLPFFYIRMAIFLFWYNLLWYTEYTWS